MQTQSLRNKSRRSHHRKTGTDHEVEHPEKSNDSDPATSDSTQDKPERTGEQSRQSRPAPAEISDKEVLHTPSSDDGNYTCQSTTRLGSEDDCLIPVKSRCRPVVQ